VHACTRRPLLFISFVFGALTQDSAKINGLSACVHPSALSVHDFYVCGFVARLWPGCGPFVAHLWFPFPGAACGGSLIDVFASQTK